MNDGECINYIRDTSCEKYFKTSAIYECFTKVLISIYATVFAAPLRMLSIKLACSFLFAVIWDAVNHS